jgi:hypothetical protein
MTKRKADQLKTGEERILATAVTAGVFWEHVERAVPHTIGLTRSYRLRYNGYERTMLPKGTPEEAAAEYRVYVDGIPGRVEANEAAQQEKILQVAHAEFERDRYRNSINPLGFHGACDAYTAAHGRPVPRAVYRRWAHSGVSEAEFRSGWYQVGIARLAEQGVPHAS